MAQLLVRIAAQLSTRKFPVVPYYSKPVLNGTLWNCLVQGV